MKVFHIVVLALCLNISYIHAYDEVTVATQAARDTIDTICINAAGVVTGTVGYNFVKRGVQDLYSGKDIDDGIVETAVGVLLLGVTWKLLTSR